MKKFENAAMPKSAIANRVLSPLRLSGRQAHVSRSVRINSTNVPTAGLNHGAGAEETTERPGQTVASRNVLKRQNENCRFELRLKAGLVAPWADWCQF
jgi:hypothetical protein